MAVVGGKGVVTVMATVVVMSIVVLFTVSCPSSAIGCRFWDLSPKQAYPQDHRSAGRLSVNDSTNGTAGVRDATLFFVPVLCGPFPYPGSRLFGL